MAINKHSLEKTFTVAVEGGNISCRLYEPHEKDAMTRPPLIALHGGPGGSHAGMYDALHSLCDNRPTVFYDQLGSHFSPAKMTPGLMRIERFADEVVQIVKARSFDRVILLGHSWGAAVAVEFALTHPEKTAGLILSAPLLSTPRWVADCNALLQNLPPKMLEAIRRCEANGATGSAEYREADRFFSKRHYCRLDNPPAAMEKHRSKRNAEIYNAMWGPSEFTCAGTLKDLDYFPRLREIAAPVLIVCGEYDTATPGTMEEARALMQNTELSVIPDSGHAVYVDGHEKYLAAVRRFLSEKVDPRPSGPKTALPRP